MIRFLDVADVTAIHADTIAVEGGTPGLRDAGLLEAAVALPRQRFGGAYLHDGLPAMAAAYLFHLAANHPFLDGNKRVAALSALVFLDANGTTLLPEPADMEQVVMAVAAGEMGKDALTEWFVRQSVG